MRSSTLLLFVLTSTLLGFSSCASLPSGTTRNVFSFNYEDQEYQIISLTTRSGEGTNYLVLSDSSGIELLNCKDADQNGTIDQVLSGGVSLEEADLIYQAGISYAQEKGNYRERIPERTYQLNYPGYSFVVRSYQISKTNVSNLFITRIDSSGIESILIDIQADGTLDHFEKGTGQISKYQSYYIATLGIGIQENKIVYRNNIYLVKQNFETGSGNSGSFASLHK